MHLERELFHYVLCSIGRFILIFAYRNLTNANHAIFLSPLLTTNEYEYRSCETQAIGRIRRYGQEKKVHVWRFLTENSIDIEIFDHRSEKKFKDFPQYKL